MKKMGEKGLECCKRNREEIKGELIHHPSTSIQQIQRVSTTKAEIVI